jgi:hypothetical protein
MQLTGMPQATAAQLAQQTVGQLQAILGQANMQHPAAACTALPQKTIKHLYVANRQGSLDRCTAVGAHQVRAMLDFKLSDPDQPDDYYMHDDYYMAGPREQLRALLRIPQWNMEQLQQANAAVQALTPQGQ